MSISLKPLHHYKVRHHGEGCFYSVCQCLIGKYELEHSVGLLQTLINNYFPKANFMLLGTPQNKSLGKVKFFLPQEIYFPKHDIHILPSNHNSAQAVF